ncbi:MAG TPA: pseudouridine synthase [Candidatus Dormibacteraeota bacterium]
MPERLNRYLARSGVASRRTADALIAGGSVLVNGRRPPADGMLIEPGRDRITVAGRPVEPVTSFLYLAVNKPAGVVVTARDPQGRPTLFDLLHEHGDRRLFYVGRLDSETRGLILVTDDGQLANRLAHPRHKVPKEYVAVVRGIPGERDLAQLRGGVELEDGRTQPAEVQLLGSAAGVSDLRIVIREGRNRQVRRMLAAVGHDVRQLRRTAFGPVRLGRLKEGGYRKLRPEEVDSLRRAAGIAEAQ